MPYLNFGGCLATLLAAIAVSVSAQAQAPAQIFPSKPVKWIVGYPAGGGSDFLARTVAAQMSVQLGQPVIIDNRAGAGAIVGAEVAARSSGDGYTLFTADNGVLIYNPALYKKLPYDPVRDFAPLGLMARTPLLIVAAPNAGIRNAQELIDMLKKNPGKLSYGSPGNGSPHHLAMELFKSRTAAFVVHVPYRGAAPAMQDAMGGQIPLIVVDTSTGMSAIKAGKLVPLVTFSKQRVSQLPDVPTMIELGYKDVEAYAWQGMVVPAGTPGDIRQKLSLEMQAAVNHPSVRKKLEEASWESVPSDAGLLSAYIVSETKKWHALIRERGISLEQ
ncbi:ABC transporter substrate-binding protein [Variovorax sp. WS11]|uniref:Bug family tripartite tricarboxylate transporter substrate binding protein n=1 Tax=Variovorax sp. WS11 TaxID=1105204 RepID=UPI000D0D7F1F|nr:tripartite tricarboxylate transporter substrate binding protein [Variovorax sp. WS11]NDZ17589.1 tripartite tricarboxylate transporter substrate binding protein [Variovorax sp. WS11]PSL82206.1 ABC transporter substrate-binding protein [Variovorax sp. WS11]